VHPELFELKALVAGRLDTHRRREIDDHLGSCAECSRHYVALMLGSASPKTAEAEAREALVPTGAGTVLTLVGGATAPAPMYGIDAPIAPSAPPRATPRPPHNNLVALETEFPPAQSRTQVPVSASLVDAISRLRAESEAPRSAAAAAPALVPAADPVPAPAPKLELVRTPEPVAAPAPAPVPAPAAVKAPEIIAPVAESPLIAPSIFTPTPYDGVSVIHPPAAPAQARTQPATELVVTFSSTPKRNTAQRSGSSGTMSPAASPVVTPSQEYVSQAIPTLANLPASEFELSAPAAPQPRAASPMPPRGAMIAAAAVAALVVGIAGFRYFQSSVSEAASAAAAAAAKKVEAAAAVRAPVTPPAAAAPAEVQTRIVYVEKPSTRKAQPTQTKPETVLVAPAVPIAVTLPEVNLNTGTEGAAQSNTQRGATSELTRSARATASRTSAPRP
jgi:hypothetical protein